MLCRPFIFDKKILQVYEKSVDKERYVLYYITVEQNMLANFGKPGDAKLGVYVR